MQKLCCFSYSQRVVQVSVTTTEGAPWKPVDGIAFANQAGEEPAVT